MTQSVLTKTTGLAWALLESYDIDPLPIFRKAHIDPALMNDMSSRTSGATQNALWASVAEKIGDPCFGLRLGHLWHPSYMHALGYAWLSSATLYSALERLSRFISIVNPNIFVEIVDDIDTVSVAVSSASDSIPRDAPWYGDVDMSILIAMCRANSGASLNPVSLKFKRAQPDCAGDFYALFRCPVSFGAQHNCMTFSRKDVEKLLPGSNPLMSEVHDQEMLRYLAGLDGGDIIYKVKNAILKLLPDGRMSDAKVAEALFMSNRNLQRKLQAQGTTFKTILTELRKELALKYIQDPQLTLTEVSFMLGFSEMSAFSRAFKQWTGQSPKASRSTDQAS